MARRDDARGRGPGLAKARGGTLRQVGGHEVLSRHAEELLFAHAELMSEGQVREQEGGGGSYFGSTMITFDLEGLAPLLRAPMDEAGQERLRRIVEGSVRVRLRAMRLACAEAARRFPDRALGTAQVETRVHVVRGKLHLDVDLEVPFDVSSKRGQR